MLGGRLRDRHLLSLRFAGAPSEQMAKMKMSNVCAQPYLSVGRFWTNRNLSQHPESFALRKKTSRDTEWMNWLLGNNAIPQCASCCSLQGRGASNDWHVLAPERIWSQTHA